MLINPKDFNDLDALQILLASAKDFAQKCRERIAELRCHEKLDELRETNQLDILDEEFWYIVFITELILKEERGKTIILGRTRQKYIATSAKEAIRSFALRQDVTGGFKDLERNNCLYLSFEAVIIRNPDCFDKEDVKAVKEKMQTMGYPDDFWVMPQ